MRVFGALGVARTLRIGGSALLAVLSGCVDGLAGPDDTPMSTVGFEVEVEAAASRIGYPIQQFELRLQPYTVREGGATTSLTSLRVLPLGTISSQRAFVMLTFDLRNCFTDPARARTGDACPLRLDVTLALTNGGLVLDHQMLGPWPAGPGIRPALDTLRLAEVGPPEVSPSTPTIAVGDTLRMSAWFITIRGDSVVRPVVWRSQNPAIASVDSSGLVTGRATGNAVIEAHFGRGQSSNGVPLIVR